MSFVHSNIKHIICNTVILFPLMYIVESSYHYKLVLLIYGFVSIYSGITYSYFYPYTKVIGCSHIVFAYTGSLLADYAINKKMVEDKSRGSGFLRVYKYNYHTIHSISL
jgi:membrane associated rhomboid family serine protease